MGGIDMKKVYMSYISHNYVCKSKVQEAVYQHLKNNDRILFSDLEKFKRDLLASISMINKGYPRNNPVEASWYQGLSKHDDWSLSIHGICNFSIHEVLIKRD